MAEEAKVTNVKGWIRDQIQAKLAELTREEKILKGNLSSFDNSVADLKAKIATYEAQIATTEGYLFEKSLEIRAYRDELNAQFREGNLQAQKGE